MKKPENQKVKIPKLDGSFIEVDAIEYDKKVLKGEGEGMTTSDAQAQADYFFIQKTGGFHSQVRAKKESNLKPSNACAFAQTITQ